VRSAAIHPRVLALSLVLMDNESVLVGEKHFADATEPDDVAEKFSRKSGVFFIFKEFCTYRVVCEY
jgi:hypothetical protein